MHLVRYINLKSCLHWIHGHLRSIRHAVLFHAERVFFDLTVIKQQMAQEFRCDKVVLLESLMSNGLFRAIQNRYLCMLPSSINGLLFIDDMIRGDVDIMNKVHDILADYPDWFSSSPMKRLGERADIHFYDQV